MGFNFYLTSVNKGRFTSTGTGHCLCNGYFYYCDGIR